MNTIPGMSRQLAERLTMAMTPQAIQAAAINTSLAGLDGRRPAWMGPSIGLLGGWKRRRDRVSGRWACFGGVTRPPLRRSFATAPTVPRGA